MTFPRMTGPQHFLEAQRLLVLAADRTEDAMGASGPAVQNLGLQLAGIYNAAALVHATLAHAGLAASPLLGEYEIEPDDLARDWADALGYRPRFAYPTESLTETASLDRAMDIEADDRRDQAEEASW